MRSITREARAVTTAGGQVFKMAKGNYPRRLVEGLKRALTVEVGHHRKASQAEETEGTVKANLVISLFFPGFCKKEIST